MFYRLKLYRATSMLNLYYLKNTSTKFFPLLMFMLSNFIYQLMAMPLKLSWKKCINNFLSCTVSVILLHYTCRWVIGHYIPIYFFFLLDSPCFLFESNLSSAFYPSLFSSQTSFKVLNIIV
jgi:hypothetical protein